MFLNLNSSLGLEPGLRIDKKETPSVPKTNDMELKINKINGIDVSKLTFDVYHQGKHYCFDNNITGFKSLLKETVGHIT